MDWQLTPWWLRLIGKPKWRVEGFGGFWYYASKRWGTIGRTISPPGGQCFWVEDDGRVYTGDTGSSARKTPLT